MHGRGQGVVERMSIPESPPVPPPPTARSAFWRALRLRCPACGGGPMFLRWLRLSPACPSCGIRFTRGECGYWLGAYFVNLMAIETAFTAMFVAWLWWTWPTPPWDAMEYGLALAMIVGPLVLYPFSHTFFFAIDLLFRPPAPEDFEAPHEASRTVRRHAG